MRSNPVKIDSIPWPEDRTRNAFPHEHSCELCDDVAWILVTYSDAGTDENAPCPRCRLGFMAEFGYGRETFTSGNQTKKRWYRDENNVYGERGYWWRNPGLQQVLIGGKDSVPLPDEENARRAAVLARAMDQGGFTEELLQELYRGDPNGLAAHRAYGVTADRQREAREGWTQNYRMKLIKQGQDPKKFWGGAAAAELEAWNRMRGPKEEA